MANVLLSQHSSNPLEVPSSDARNTAYRHEYFLAKQEGQLDGPGSSDDPLDGCNAPELEEYHNHLAQLYSIPKTSVTHPDDASHLTADDEWPTDDPAFPSDILIEAQEEAEEDDEMDAYGETDEEMSIYLKSREEQEEIEEEITDLEAAVPLLTADYKILDRLGTGTFSSVYKAIDLGYHSKWDNSPWQGFHPPSSSAYYQSTPRPRESKVYVAVKRIYVTSGPERIRNEISIMEDCRGCRHSSQLITAFRERDQVVAIMPYHRNDDFRDFYRRLPLQGIKAYFRCMFRALRDIHARGVIHRDVKPANFLFDPRTGIGTLCDFGLASRMEPGPALGVCLHTSPSREFPHGRIRPREEYDIDYIKKMQKEGRLKSAWPSEKVGYPQKDTRPHSKANRAGTRGFRAPEVLLKCGEQTGAIDVWSAGTILLFFLTGKFPIFHSSDDIEALMEIATIIGKKRMEKAATLHSRVFQSNLPSLTPDGISWRTLIERLNPNLRVPPKPEPHYYPYYSTARSTTRPPPSSSSSSSRYSASRSTSPDLSSSVLSPESYSAEIDCALDFVEQVMQPESTRRITPRRALYHPFLRDSEEPEDDEFFPHPFGEGVCGKLHFIDDVTDDPCVRVRVWKGQEGEMEIKRLDAGEGIAIGSRPCEFHREGYVNMNVD